MPHHPSTCSCHTKVAGVWVWSQWTGSWPWPDPQFGSWKGQGQRGSQIVWFMVQGYGIYSDPVWTCSTQFWTYNMLPFVANEYWYEIAIQGLKLTRALVVTLRKLHCYIYTDNKGTTVDFLKMHTDGSHPKVMHNENYAVVNWCIKWNKQ